MSANIIVKRLLRPAMDRQEYEMCEHKGIGHPDTLTDAMCEAASRELSLAYLREFGRVMHHNLDKGLLIAGASAPRFRGGTVTQPIKVVICGRATEFKNHVDVREIAVTAARHYLQQHIRCDTNNFTIMAEIREGSKNLQNVMPGRREVVLSNDTSFGVGFAPYSRLEQTVLDLAKVLISGEFRQSFPVAGDDFKVMAYRAAVNGSPVITIALALVDRYVESVEHYFSLKNAIRECLLSKLPAAAELRINMLDDDHAKDERGIYVTVSGLSAEMGDDGLVGRGNRVSGLITPNRMMSLEAAAGKNPVSHVGKIYNVLAMLLARDIYEKIGAVEEVNVQLLSTIGRPIHQPQVTVIELGVEKDITGALSTQVRMIVNNWLTNIDKVTDRILSQQVAIF
ncbi:MAG: methionine adenosyltransferase [Gammaproteobacteria bacterium]|nr:methionine adenosyltransferase [Gammaproteobacteria bacterium]